MQNSMPLINKAWFKLLLIVALAIIAAVIREVLLPVLHETPYIVFIPVVVISALFGSMSLGFLSIFISIAAASVLYEPGYPIGFDIPGKLPGAIVFIVANIIVTILCNQARKARESLKISHSSLEEQIDQRTKALKSERRRLMDVLETLPVYVILLSPDYHVTFANKFFRGRFGESGERRCYEYLFNRSAPCEDCQTYKVLQTKNPHRWEWTGPDGRNYDIYDFPFAEVDGTTHIMEMGIDITDRKQAEDALRKMLDTLEDIVSDRTNELKQANTLLEAEVADRKKTGEALLRAKEEWERTFNSVPDLIAIIDNQHRMVRVNDAMAKSLGMTAAECEGMPCYKCVHGLSSAPSFCPHSQTLNDSQQHVQEVYEPRLDGYFLVSTTPLTDTHGKMIGSVHVARDITKRKEAEEILKRDNETLEKLVSERSRRLIEAQLELERSRRLSDIGTLAATVAHELRNPLAAINMAAANIRRKAENPSLDKHLDNIEKKVSESDEIINNLLFYARIRAPVYEKVDMHGILAECYTMSQKHFKKKISFKKEFGCLKNVVIDADPTQIKEIFYNLLNNAHDAVLDAKGKIKIEAKILDNAVKVNVSDNGSGIDEQDLARIFEPFFTTKAKGTGLGLTVCRQIVDLHGGKIDIDSKTQKGTTVTVTLPKTKSAAIKLAPNESIKPT